MKLWISYSAYFEPLGDAEVGRLARAMIEYKSHGVEPKFSGNERFVWPAIKRDIDEAERIKTEFQQKQSDNGAKGGRPQKPKKPNPFSENPKNPSLFPETQKSQGLRTKDKGQRTTDKGQSTTVVVDNAREDDGTGEVFRRFMDEIHPTPSQSCIDEIRGYVEEMGADCVLRAIDIAIDNKVPKWTYIRAVLQDKLREGVRSLADWDALEEKRAEASARGGAAQMQRAPERKSFAAIAAEIEAELKGGGG